LYVHSFEELSVHERISMFILSFQFKSYTTLMFYPPEMFCSTDLQTLFRTHFAGIFVIYVYIKFYILRYK